MSARRTLESLQDHPIELNHGLPYTPISGPEGTLIAKVYSVAFGDHVQSAEYAARIIACVNACAGTTTGDLHKIAEHGGWQAVSMEWKLDRERLEQQLRAKLAEQDKSGELSDDDSIYIGLLENRIAEYRVKNERLEQQRDELLAALRKISALDYANAAINCAAYAAHKIAEEAIAKARGQS